jgi:hypothetical protein
MYAFLMPRRFAFLLVALVLSLQLRAESPKLSKACGLLLSYNKFEEILGPKEKNLLYMLGGSNGHGFEVDLKLYRGASAILSLSDGQAQDFRALGPFLAFRLPETKVVSGDISFQGRYRAAKNLELVEMDNRRRFPFKDNRFDRIVLRRGLCVCYGKLNCAGFAPDSEQAFSFFREVARVLDKKKKSSVALLHGWTDVSPHILMVWLKFFSRIEKDYPVQFELLGTDGEALSVDPHRFTAVLVRPKGR